MKISLHPRRFFPASSLGQRWLELGVSRLMRQPPTLPAELPPPPDSDDDVLAPLRRVTCGGAS